jgi:hypothetical protein
VAAPIQGRRDRDEARADSRGEERDETREASPDLHGTHAWSAATAGGDAGEWGWRRRRSGRRCGGEGRRSGERWRAAAAALIEGGAAAAALIKGGAAAAQIAERSGGG